jgi:methylated-DNA-protein-cysteine methyltransferase-like protein
LNYSEKVYKAVSLIPKGKVSTYKQIAKLTGIKNPRLVGFILHKNTDPKKIPCHRVIKSDGKLASGYAFGGLKKQKKLLEKEGINFLTNGKIALQKYLFNP